MEADWSVELAAKDAVIVVPWTEEEASRTFPETSTSLLRFIDLRGDEQTSGRLLDGIEEARDRPALRNALATLNREGSHLWTTKCDAWEAPPASRDWDPEAGVRTIPRAIIDPWEMDASPEEAICSAGSYVDLVLRDDQARASFEIQEQWIRRLTGVLREIPLRCARTDLVLRGAEVEGAGGFGVTWFTEACGANAEDARQRWAEALITALPILMDAQWLHESFGNATIAKSLGE